MLVADESPYFLFSNYYGRLSKLFNRWAYNQYDAFICIGEMEAYLVRATLNNPSKKILRTTINGVSEEKLSRLKEKSYDIHSNRIVFIGSGPANWRVWYKGLDVMLQAFKKYSALNPQATFEIAGDWDQESIVTYLGENSDRIKFLGHVKNIEEFLEGAALYLHIGRGDAWPIAIMESMAAGIIPVVSEWTGAKECVAQVSPDLIVKVDVDEVFKKMNWFFEISGTERLKLSTRCKEIASLYPEQKAISRFKECFDSIESKLI